MYIDMKEQQFSQLESYKMLCFYTEHNFGSDQTNFNLDFNFQFEYLFGGLAFNFEIQIFHAFIFSLFIRYN